MLYALLITVHIIVCVFLIIAVLLQSGKGADIGAVFGGSGSQALFGSAGPADFLNKATRYMVVVFMLTSLILGYKTFEKPTQSVMDSKAVSTPAAPVTQQALPGQQAAPAQPQTIPVTPVQPVAPPVPVQPK